MSIFFRLLRSLLLGLVFLSIASCYDGWEPRSNGNGTGEPNPPTNVTKPIFYLEFLPIYLNDDALNTTSCFGATGTESYRSKEWQMRTSGIEKALTDSVQDLRTFSVGIAPADCNTLDTIETKAISSTALESIADDPLDRPIIQLKAIFWDGDVPGLFSSAVTRENWSSATILKSRGRKVLSLVYFVRSNKAIGHFSNWYGVRSASTNSSRVLVGTPIDTVNPTAAGESLRASLAVSDANAVVSWVLTEAAKL